MADTEKSSSGPARSTLARTAKKQAAARHGETLSRQTKRVQKNLAQRRYITVVAEHPAMKKIAYFCSQRCKNSNSVIELVSIVHEKIAPVQLRSLGELAKEEVRDEAERVLAYYAGHIQQMSGKIPVVHMLHQNPAAEIVALCASGGSQNLPSWLIIPYLNNVELQFDLLAELNKKRMGDLNIPIIIIPEDISFSTLDQLS